MFLSACSTPMGLAAVLWGDESAGGFEFALVTLKEEQNPLLDKETYKAVEFDRTKADSCNTSVVKPGAAKWGQISKMGHGLIGRDTFLVCHISVWDSAGTCPYPASSALGDRTWACTGTRGACGVKKEATETRKKLPR